MMAEQVKQSEDTIGMLGKKTKKNFVHLFLHFCQGNGNSKSSVSLWKSFYMSFSLQHFNPSPSLLNL